jgi:dipeptidyl aminopeptidase/acylaminoacyl peptidase
LVGHPRLAQVSRCCCNPFRWFRRQRTRQPWRPGLKLKPIVALPQQADTKLQALGDLLGTLSLPHEVFNLFASGAAAFRRGLTRCRRRIRLIHVHYVGGIMIYEKHIVLTTLCPRGNDMSWKKFCVVLFVVCAFVAAVGAQASRRPLKLDDLFRFRNVSDPQLSPDGLWVAYTVSSVDVKADRSSSDIWLMSYDGKTERRITFTADQSESSPRWSPDGKYLSFVSSRPGPNRGSQVWALDRAGGEAMQLTETKGRLQGYEWSPDSKRLALTIGDPDPDEPATPDPAKPPKPIVIDRYRYKQDGQGYLLSGRHSYIYLYDIAAKKLDRLTKGKADESSPAFSPDGARIAFTSNRAPDPDREPSFQIFVADATPGSAEKAVTPAANRAGRGAPEWSPDGKWLAYLETDEKSLDAYSMQHLTLVPSDGSAAPVRFKATEDLDRGVSDPKFSADGKFIHYFVTDDRSVYPARASLAGGASEKILQPPVVAGGWSWAKGNIALMSGSDNKPNEVYALENGKLRQLTRQNDALMAELDIPPTEEVGFNSKDGTEVHGLLTYPVGYVKGTKVPLLLRIHGGPNSQDQHSFAQERQFFAANGYAVLAVNYRGSAGRGKKFSRAIAADWGHYEVEDLLAGVDHAVKMGVADPDKLGVGGWSYGGILTDYLIASDNRFKAGTSGAGTAFTVAFYGTDQYIIQYDHEIGPPWDAKAWETYQKISYPFLRADRIKTPTLFLGGERDFNVPIQGSQQMYQALRTLGVDTQLIIYPNENHGIQRPSYVRDRYERYLAWYDKYVRKLAPAPKSPLAAWEGKWRGPLVNLPAKPGAAAVEVTREIGPFPTADNTCSRFKTTYRENGEVKGVKDYKLCRGAGAEDLYFDEGNGAKLPARVIGDALVSPFKYGAILMVATTRLRGEALEEEILTIDDKPAVTGVQPMLPKGVQRLELRRVPEGSN